MIRVFSKNPLSVFRGSNIGMFVIFTMAIWYGSTLDSIDPTIRTSLPTILIMEFIMVHSGAFFAGLTMKDISKTTKILAIVSLSILYLMFILAIGYSVGSFFPIYAFVMLTLGRISDIFNPNVNTNFLIGKSFGYILAYILSVSFAMMFNFPWGSGNEYPALAFESDLDFRLFAIWGLFYFFALSLIDIIPYIFSRIKNV